MSFGYSVGDFIGGANLTYRLIKALSETQGASVEYQEAIHELGSIQQTFLQVSQMKASNVLCQATINAASHIVLSSMELIGSFLERAKKYQRKLSGYNSGSSVVNGSWRKMGWALFKSDELKALRDALHLKLTAIGVLLSSARFHGDIPSAASKFQVASFEDSESPAKNQKKSDRREGALESVHSDYNFQAQDVSARSLLSKNKKGLEQFQQNDTRYTTQTPQADSSLEERFRRLEDMLQEESIRRPMREKEDRHGSLRSDSEVNKKTHDSVPMATHESKENADILQKIQSLLYSAPKEEMKEKRKPIRLKDAIGRKFSFPYELCKTWSGMADLIQEAFLHIDAIGPHVAEGHYDLLGPSNEIILPKTWESVIEPDWAITMHMWPMPEPQPQETTVNEPRRSFEDPLPRRRKRPGHDLPSPPHLPFRPPPPDPQYNGEQAPKSKKKVRSKKSAGVLLTPSAHHTTVDDMPAYDFGQHLRDRSPRSKLSSASSVGATNSRVESDRISDDIVEVIEHEGPFADIPETTLPDAEGVEEDETVPSSTAWATDGESEHTPGSTTDMSELNEAHPQLVDDILESSADD